MYSKNLSIILTLFILISANFAFAEENKEKDEKNAPDNKTIVQKEIVVETPEFTIVADELSSQAANQVDQFVNQKGFNYFIDLSSSGDYYENLDFRKLAPPTAPFIDIYDSDDRTIYATTRIGAGISYQPIEPLTLGVAASHTGLWGNDTIGSTDNNGGFFFVERLHVNWQIWKNDIVSIDTKIGRQHFSIGGYQKRENGKSVASKDYLFSDIIDGVTLNVDFGKGGRIRLLPIDIFAVGARPDDINAASKYGPSKEKLFTMRFNGAYNTYRYGAIYENTELVSGLSTRAFFFFSNIGAPGTGSDRSFRGATGNVIDNDYTWMTGIRINYGIDITKNFYLGAAGEFAQSGGIDRKSTQSGYYDVDTIGSAFGGSLDPILTFNTTNIHIPLGFFYASGGRHTQHEGLPYSHGFVSFKGNNVGGLILGSGLGWRPSAYIGSSGISDNPHDKKRRSGTMVASAGINSNFFNDVFGIHLNAWFLKDTSSTSLFNAENVDEKIKTAANQLAFGYTKSDLLAQKRLGKILATEIDLSLYYQPFSMLKLEATGAVLLPGEFYKTEIDRQVGTFIGSNDPVTGWATTVGLTLTL